jgi:putative ABC transport system permease protein
VRNERKALLTASWLLVVLAIAGVAVLVGARMAHQLRRVGLLKAVGATPRLVVSVLLAEYLLAALAGAAAGLLVGRLLAPAFADPGAGVVGGGGDVPFPASTIVLVVAVALGVVLVATLVPALNAARVSTVRALADTARAPRRIPWLMALTRRAPVPLLLGLRIAGRRPRRALLSVASVAVAVTGLVTALAAHNQLSGQQGAVTHGVADPRTTGSATCCC